MARSYAKLLVSIWDPESDYRELSHGAQWLYEALLSHPRLTAAGVVPYQPRQWARLANDVMPRLVERWFAELVGHPSRKLVYDADTEEVFVRAHMRVDGGAVNPNMGKAMRRAIEAIESHALREAAEAEWARAIERPTEDPTEDPSQGSSPDPTEGPSGGPNGQRPKGAWRAASQARGGFVGDLPRAQNPEPRTT